MLSIVCCFGFTGGNGHGTEQVNILGLLDLLHEFDGGCGLCHKGRGLL